MQCKKRPYSRHCSCLILCFIGLISCQAEELVAQQQQAASNSGQGAYIAPYSSQGSLDPYVVVTAWGPSSAGPSVSLQPVQADSSAPVQPAWPQANPDNAQGSAGQQSSWLSSGPGQDSSSRPGPPGGWHHRHHYPDKPALLPTSTTAGPPPSAADARKPPTPVFIPGKGWATIVWTGPPGGQPPTPATTVTGPRPGWPSFSPSPSPAAAATGSPWSTGPGARPPAMAPRPSSSWAPWSPRPLGLGSAPSPSPRPWLVPSKLSSSPSPADGAAASGRDSFTPGPWRRSRPPWWPSGSDDSDTFDDNDNDDDDDTSDDTYVPPRWPWMKSSPSPSPQPKGSSRPPGGAPGTSTPPTKQPPGSAASSPRPSWVPGGSAAGGPGLQPRPGSLPGILRGSNSPSPASSLSSGMKSSPRPGMPGPGPLATPGMQGDDTADTDTLPELIDVDIDDPDGSADPDDSGLWPGLGFGPNRPAPGSTPTGPATGGGGGVPGRPGLRPIPTIPVKGGSTSPNPPGGTPSAAGAGGAALGTSTGPSAGRPAIEPAGKPGLAGPASAKASQQPAAGMPGAAPRSSPGPRPTATATVSGPAGLKGPASPANGPGGLSAPSPRPSGPASMPSIPGMNAEEEEEEEEEYGSGTPATPTPPPGAGRSSSPAPGMLLVGSKPGAGASNAPAASTAGALQPPGQRPTLPRPGAAAGTAPTGTSAGQDSSEDVDVPGSEISPLTGPGGPGGMMGPGSIGPGGMMGPGSIGPGGMMRPGSVGPGGMMGPGSVGPGGVGPGGVMGPGSAGPGSMAGPGGKIGPGGMMGPGMTGPGGKIGPGGVGSSLGPPPKTPGGLPPKMRPGASPGPSAAAAAATSSSSAAGVVTSPSAPAGSQQQPKGTAAGTAANAAPVDAADDEGEGDMLDGPPMIGSAPGVTAPSSPSGGGASQPGGAAAAAAAGSSKQPPGSKAGGPSTPEAAVKPGSPAAAAGNKAAAATAAAGAAAARGGSSGSASSTAATGGPAGFGLAPAITAKPGGVAPVPMSGGADPSLQGPEPFLYKTPGAQKTILIGCTLPFKGSDQEIEGQSIFQGLKMAINDTMKELKLPVNVNLTCLNSRCLDIPAHMAAKQLAQAGAVALMGDVCSVASVAAAGVAAEYKIPIISSASTSPQLSSMEFFFRTVPSDRYQGAAAAELARSMGVRNMGMIYEDTPYGYGLAFNFIAAFTRDGGSVPVVYTFKKFQGNVKEALDKMLAGKEAKENKLDAVFISTNNLTFSTAFLRAAQAAQLDLPTFGGDSLGSPAMGTMAPDSPSLLRRFTATNFGAGKPEFGKRVRAVAPGTDSGAAARGYDAMAAFLKAFAATAAPREPKDVAKLIPKQKFDGMSGPIEFDDKGDLIPHNNTYVKAKFDEKTGKPMVVSYIPLP